MKEKPSITITSSEWKAAKTTTKCAHRGCLTTNTLFSIGSVLNIQYKGNDGECLFCPTHFNVMLEIYSIFKGCEDICQKIGGTHFFHMDTSIHESFKNRKSLRQIEDLDMCLRTAIDFRQQFQDFIDPDITVKAAGHNYWLKNIKSISDVYIQILDERMNGPWNEVVNNTKRMKCNDSIKNYL